MLPDPFAYSDYCNTRLSLVHSKYNVGSVRSKSSSWRSETSSEPSTTVLAGCARLPPSRVLPDGTSAEQRVSRERTCKVLNDSITARPR